MKAGTLGSPAGHVVGFRVCMRDGLTDYLPADISRLPTSKPQCGIKCIYALALVLVGRHRRSTPNEEP